MSKELLRLGLALSLLGVPGCFSHIPFQEAPAPTPDQTVLYIYRPDSPPMLRKASVFINDQQVGDLASKEFTWISLPAGSYILHVKWSPELAISMENINVHIREKETIFVKIEPATKAELGAVFLIESKVRVRLSAGNHPDQITRLWPLNYVEPNVLTVKPLQ